MEDHGRALTEVLDLRERLAAVQDALRRERQRAAAEAARADAAERALRVAIRCGGWR